MQPCSGCEGSSSQDWSIKLCSYLCAKQHVCSHFGWVNWGAFFWSQGIPPPPPPKSTEHVTEVLECSEGEQERTSMKKTLNTQWKWPLGSWLLSEQLKHLMFVHCKDWLKCLCLCFLSLSLSLLVRLFFKINFLLSARQQLPLFTKRGLVLYSASGA